MPDPRDTGVTDMELITRFRLGDEAAFETLVTRHREVAYRVARRLAGRHAEADDLVQEAFLRAYRSLSSFRGESLFRTWLVRILMNLAVNSRKGRLQPGGPADLEAQPGKETGALEVTLRHQVRRAVDGLPPRQKQVLILKVYEGLKFAEVAEAAGMSVGTAKATFFQAVRRLRSRLDATPMPATSGEVES